MSESDDPAVTLDAKLHRFVDGLSPDEVQVFNDLLAAWAEAGGGAEVEGFAAQRDDQKALNNLQQLMGMLSNIMRSQHDTQQAVIRNIR